jgi:hypothetical protein
MCNPTLALIGVSMAMTAAGTVTSSQAADSAREASTNAVNAAVLKQGQHQQVEQQLFQNSLNQNNPDLVKANAAAATGQRMAELTTGGGVKGVDLLPGQDGNTSSATKAAISQHSGVAQGQLQQEAQGRASLGGLNDAFRALAIGTQPNADRIGLEANYGAGDSALLPLGMAVANRQGAGLRTLGSLFTGLGSAAAAGAGGGAGGGIADASGRVQDFFNMPGWNATAASNIAGGAAGL